MLTVLVIVHHLRLGLQMSYEGIVQDIPRESCIEHDRQLEAVLFEGVHSFFTKLSIIIFNPLHMNKYHTLYVVCHIWNQSWQGVDFIVEVMTFPSSHE